MLPSRVIEQIVLNAVTLHLQDNQGIRHRQQGFRKGRSCLNKLISFYDQVTHLVNEAVDIVYLDFSKASNTISHDMFLGKLAVHMSQSACAEGGGKFENTWSKIKT